MIKIYYREIENCFQCPHFREVTSHIFSGECKEKSKLIKRVSPMPEWCPLPNKSEK